MPCRPLCSAKAMGAVGPWPFAPSPVPGSQPAFRSIWRQNGAVSVIASSCRLAQLAVHTQGSCAQTPRRIMCAWRSSSSSSGGGESSSGRRSSNTPMTSLATSAASMAGLRLQHLVEAPGNRRWCPQACCLWQLLHWATAGPWIRLACHRRMCHPALQSKHASQTHCCPV